MRLPLLPWRPDQATISAAGVADARGVIRTASGYKSLAGPVKIGSQVPAKPILGFMSAKDKFDNSFDIAVFGVNIYSFTNGTWQNISRGAGYSVTADVARILGSSYTGYFTAKTRGRWRFTQYNQSLIATDGVNPVQVLTLGSTQPFADLSATAPKGYFIAQCRGFVVLGDTTDIYDGRMGARLWWSAINDPATWDGNAAEDQSDFQDLQNAGNVQAVIGGQYLTILLEQGIYLGEYVGSPIIFEFSLIANAKGCAVAGSVIVVGINIYYLADDGFYVLANGEYPNPISNQKVSKWFYTNVNIEYIEYMSTAYNALENAIYWTFCSNSTFEGVPDTILVYQIDTSEFTYIQDDIALFGNYVSPAVTLDQLTQILDSITVPLDSSTFYGGSEAFAAISATGYLETFTGAPYAGFIETFDMQLAAPARGVVTELSLLAETDTTSQIQVGSRNRIGDPVTWENARTVQPSGLFYSRKEGRYHRLRVILNGTWSNATAIDVSGQATSSR